MATADAAAVFDCPAYRLPFAGSECARRCRDATAADEREEDTPPGLFWCAHCPAGQDRARALLDAGPDNDCNDSEEDLVTTTATPPDEERLDKMGRRVGDRTAKGIDWVSLRARLEVEHIERLAAELGCSGTAVRKAIAKLGVVRRPAAGAASPAPTTATPAASVTSACAPEAPAGNAKRTKLPRLPGENDATLARANETLAAIEERVPLTEQRFAELVAEGEDLRRAFDKRTEGSRVPPFVPAEYADHPPLIRVRTPGERDAFARQRAADAAARRCPGVGRTLDTFSGSGSRVACPECGATFGRAQSRNGIPLHDRPLRRRHVSRPVPEPVADETLAALGEDRLTPREAADVEARMTCDDRAAVRDLFPTPMPDVLQVELPRVVLGMLDTLAASGLWGTDRAAVLRTLAQERLQDLARDGLLVLR